MSSEFVLKLIPSDDGASAFVRGGQKLTRVALAGGIEAIGLTLPQYDATLIARLTQTGMIERIEAESPDLLRHRNAIQELSKVTGSAAIDQAFARDVTRITKTMGATSRPGKPESNQSDAQPIATMKMILSWLKGTKRSTVESAAALVRRLDRRILLAIDGVARADATGMSIRSFRELVLKYTRRLEIPDYFGLVVLELVNNFQVQVMQSFAKKAGMSTAKIRTLYQDAAVRDQISRLMQEQGETSAVGWRVYPREGSGRRTTDLTVTLAGSGAPMEALSTEVKQKSSISLGERSLTEFYNDSDESVFNIELGLYYLSYLDELCEKAGITFKTIIREIAGTGNRIVILKMAM